MTQVLQVDPQVAVKLLDKVDDDIKLLLLSYINNYQGVPDKIMGLTIPVITNVKFSISRLLIVILIILEELIRNVKLLLKLIIFNVLKVY